jgi:hypothetical protein
MLLRELFPYRKTAPAAMFVHAVLNHIGTDKKTRG